MRRYKEFLESAQISALKAAKYIRRNIKKINYFEFKGERNLVTEVDRRSEEIIREYLGKKFPHIPVVGEEEGGEKGEGLFWLIDPLDGTNNFTHGFPVFAVSVALVEKKEPIIAVIYDPLREELFWAIKGKGSYLNRKKIFVSKTKKLSLSLVATGFYYEFKTAEDTNIEHFIKFLYRVQGIRRTGSACIDLAWVASGRIDGFWELGLRPWDMAGGYLLVKEAGGKVTRLNGEKFNIFYPEIVASNGLIHKEMLKVLKEK